MVVGEATVIPDIMGQMSLRAWHFLDLIDDLYRLLVSPPIIVGCI